MRTQRIDLIEKYIMQEKSVTLDALCEKFNVSKNTIRRDIDSLAEKGVIRKVYGGVTAVSASGLSPKLIPYETRHFTLPEEKDKICRLASQYVKDGDIIYIDTGTTCLNMVDHISDRQCTILTNSLQVCLKAVPYPNLNIISLPGKLKRETLSYVGSEIVDYLKTYNIGKAFMACSGATIENGLTNATTEEYIVKKAVMENTGESYLLADHTKFGHFSLMTYAHLEDIDYIITDQTPGNEYTDFCQEHQIQVVTCEESNTSRE
ncbi:DeoR/GlpR transcriptional regulator [Clostridium sp. AF19-22AC]|jgi:DeoR family myo-inositol catabolism operon transcriptional repressor|uniref:DeoR/GlpR family DNA-binding transcription regulator n=1 Tax=Clostridia TaxID=186801 RepID=UPI000E51C372|nr:MULTISPECIES: DeoR/GlpR family DNA-binding transcription regulator [Clostridia]RHR21760.1 DeoR/GlpR transcriptional regulator [Clostridium sp. AF19-22AC]